MAFAALGALRRIALAHAVLASSALMKIIARRVRIAFASGDAAIRADRPQVLRTGLGLRRRPSGSGVLTRAGAYATLRLRRLIGAQ
jgi:hypothetical protein